LLSNSLLAKAVTNGISQSELQAQERMAAEVLFFFVSSYQRQREYFRWFLPICEGQLQKNVSFSSVISICLLVECGDWLKRFS